MGSVITGAGEASAEASRAAERADRNYLYYREAVALLAHDINNGLAAAIANLSSLANADLPPRDAESAEMAMRALRQLTALVRNFVDIGRLEDAALAPRLRETDLSKLLVDVGAVHFFGGPSDRAQLELRCDAPMIARVDPVLIERALHNIVGNAARYVNDGGVVGMTAYIDDSGPARRLIIEIGNTGSAVADDVRGSLFDKFSTGGDSRARTGQGLYFCRLVCEAHGGRISLRDSARFPVCFALELPV